MIIAVGIISFIAGVLCGVMCIALCVAGRDDDMIKSCGTCLYGRRIRYNCIDGSGCTNLQRQEDWAFYCICQDPPCPTYYPDPEQFPVDDFKESGGDYE